MAILPGTRLGPYEVVSAIGAGGMGEVYRARDTRLDRTVAIKILRDHLADRSELRERFEREARTIASLNHPHICTLYDIGHQDGADFLVMECLEGETLAQKLTKGPLPLDQVLRHAVEISDALDKAHRKGVTHRDLKPGNIMLTKSGAKLLDFGLAKLQQETSPVVGQSQVPTANQPITAQGTIVGTLQYMAPEQLEGKEADARTDIFAFGTVVYEMATAKKAFEGKSQATVIAKILETDPPPISALQPMTSPALDRAVKRCLAKDPDDRWQSASDLANELRWIAEGGFRTEVSASAVAMPTRASRRQVILWSSLAFLIGAAIASITIWNLKPWPSPARPVTRAVITLPPGQRLTEFTALAISPDGSNLAYVARAIQGGGTPQIYVRAMDSSDAKPIPGTEGAVNPFFSPDGRWLGFFADGKLKKISVNGGGPVTLGDAADPRGASWSSQGMIVFAPAATGPLEQVSDMGGSPQPLTRLGKGEISHRWPEFLPGGKALLFVSGTAAGNWINGQVEVQSVGSDQRRDLVQGAMKPHYVPSGHLIYAQGGRLMAVAFDPQRLQVTGTALPVEQGILQNPITGAAQYSISDTGSLVYALGGLQMARSSLVWMSRNGTEQPLTAPERAYEAHSLSPDGRHVALGTEQQVWIYDLERETLTRFTFEGNNGSPLWTPDGKRIAYTSNKEGTQNLFWQLADGSGAAERLVSDEYNKFPSSFSPDGQLLAFVEATPTTGGDIWILRLADRKVWPFLRTPFNEGSPEFSPDGRWLAYVSDESGRREVYVQPYPGPGGKWQISTEGGIGPMWNRNGRELFYRSGNKMMTVDISTQSGFVAGKPRQLFEGHYVPNPFGYARPNYDVSPDGQRFLMIKPVEQEQAPTQINVVLNWTEELKRLVPTGK